MTMARNREGVAGAADERTAGGGGGAAGGDLEVEAAAAPSPLKGPDHEFILSLTIKGVGVVTLSTDGFMLHFGTQSKRVIFLPDQSWVEAVTQPVHRPQVRVLARMKSMDQHIFFGRNNRCC